MNCKNCGANIDESKGLPKFCPNCGAQIVRNEDGTVNTVDRQRPIVINNTSAVKAGTNGYAIVGLIMAILVQPILGLIFGIIGLYNSKKINSGSGTSMAAIVISSIWIAIVVIAIIIASVSL